MNQPVNQFWWEAWATKDLSPVNPLAIVAMRLAPPEDWQSMWEQREYRSHYAQLWWLQWHARPDLRRRQLGERHMPLYSGRILPKIHPQTIAEWAEPPQWTEELIRIRENMIRRTALSYVRLTAAQTLQIHASTWDSLSLGYQAAQSRVNGERLLERIQQLGPADLTACLAEYLYSRGTFPGKCGEYLLSHAVSIEWDSMLATPAVENLHPFPTQLMPCLLNSSDPKVRQMGADLSQQQKEKEVKHES